MFYEIFKFEILYRARRAETYLYFFLLLLCSILAVDFIFQGTGQASRPDAPYSIAFAMAVTSAIFMMIASMIMGTAVLRDFDHRMESLMFVNPMTKGEYLLGRFLGSFMVLLVVFSGLLFGMMLGHFMPWRDHTEESRFQAWRYVQPFISLVVPNLFFAGSLFFVSGALSRKFIVVYTQGIILLVVYILISITTTKLEDADLPGLLDPFTINTLNRVVEHWTLTDRNTQMILINNVLLVNRLIWTGVGVVALVIGYVGFTFNVVRNNSAGNRVDQRYPDGRVNHNIPWPVVNVLLNARAKFRQLIHHSFFHFTLLWREIPFWAIAICGAAIIFVNGISLGTSHGVDSYPATYLIVEELQELSVPFFLLILIFYSGELVWKERDIRMSQIYDALPTSNLISLSARFIGIALAYTTLLLALCVSGIVMQTLSGFYEYNVPVYFTGFFVEVLPFLILYTFVSFFFQVVINHKFMAHLATLLFAILTLVLEAFGYSHDLIRFGGDGLGVYSEMNGYGHFLEPYLWIKSYWLSIGSLIFLAAVLFSVRGMETRLKTRWQMSRPFTKSIVRLAGLAGLFLLITVSYVFYNTNILNQYDSQHEQHVMQVSYERTLKHYEYIPQPKVVDVKLRLDLYPHQRNYSAEGRYILVNQDSIPIHEIHVQKTPDRQVKLNTVRFDRAVSKGDVFDEFSYTVYRLRTALQPGDSITMEFNQSLTTPGFVEGESNTEVVYNGTFLRSTDFPSLGYNRYFELTDEPIRKEFKLTPRSTRAKRSDPYELKNAVSGDDGYEINFEIMVSTDSSQVAVAPGNLRKEWVDGNRRHFHYKMEQPMINFYSIVSAAYEVVRDEWVPADSVNGAPIDLEIYYHKSHTYNLDRMMKSMKASFDYFTKHFGSYPYEQMRIMEYPRYRKYAQSLPGTVPFSEALGFVLNIDDEKDVDMAFYVTAHELAHQWWGLQVVAANVEGRDMILESLAQYSALMVMTATFGEEKVALFLKSQLKEYLKGRSTDERGEKPLALSEGDPYQHYNKGALTLYAFQDHISEEKVNGALQRFIKEWNAFGGSRQRSRYATTDDLLGYFKSVAPDSLQYVITDLFETITLHDIGITSSSYENVAEGKYKVTVAIDALKFRADSAGLETAIPVNDWIDIGIYTFEGGKNECVYLQKHKITGQRTEYEIVVDRLPSKAAIDPRQILIDKNEKDNEAKLAPVGQRGG